MGFGTLFIGYFLLLNITYTFCLTDIIAAAIMALGLYKLSSVNKDFTRALYSSYAFILFSLAELVIEGLNMFGITKNYTDIIPYVSMARYVIVFVLTMFMLRGIADVANEVGIKALEKRASHSVIANAIIYALCFVFEIPPIATITSAPMAIIGLVLLLSLFVIVIVNLVTIYTAYMRICMPEDENEEEEKPSRFAFVNKYREHRMQKEREYAEYKLEKAKKKAEKKKKKR